MLIMLGCSYQTATKTARGLTLTFSIIYSKQKRAGYKISLIFVDKEEKNEFTKESSQLFLQ
jgi:hypothetical protein